MVCRKVVGDGLGVGLVGWMAGLGLDNGWLDRMDGGFTDPKTQHVFPNLQISALPFFPPRTPSLLFSPSLLLF